MSTVFPREALPTSKPNGEKDDLLAKSIPKWRRYPERISASSYMAADLFLERNRIYMRPTQWTREVDVELDDVNSIGRPYWIHFYYYCILSDFWHESRDGRYYFPPSFNRHSHCRKSVLKYFTTKFGFFNSGYAE